MCPYIHSYITKNKSDRSFHRSENTFNATKLNRKEAEVVIYLTQVIGVKLGANSCCVGLRVPQQFYISYSILSVMLLYVSHCFPAKLDYITRIEEWILNLEAFWPSLVFQLIK